MIKYGDIEIWKCRICNVEVEAAGSGFLDVDVEKLAAVDSSHQHDMYYLRSAYRRQDEESSGVRSDDGDGTKDV